VGYLSGAGLFAGSHGTVTPGQGWQFYWSGLPPTSVGDMVSFCYGRAGDQTLIDWTYAVGVWTTKTAK
ncbi:MAG: hypothetical protein ACLFVO_27460, partial [Chloroflexaceae bacterium]